MITQKRIDGLNYLEIKNSNATAKIALQGAHLFEYKRPHQAPLIWLSKTAQFQKNKAIRGGIPICWPWFGAHPVDTSLPNHGFARTMEWTYEKGEEVDDGKTKIVLGLKDNEETLTLWPYAFELTLEIYIADTLELILQTKNCSDEAFEISEALHTYFHVDAISDTLVHGLEGKQYFNKLDKSYDNVQSRALVIENEVDRVYFEAYDPIEIVGMKGKISIKSEGSASAIVWNPWAQRINEMPDMSGYKQMLCIESGNVLHECVKVMPNETHLLKVSYS
ncbi:MAG TPA: D-hexose-6-phosphate mutarotase [Helicobacteraceae bacterium]|nr:D-hexose-6-phosphate mutarotase [Helicobacteraceae bacterium]